MKLTFMGTAGARFMVAQQVAASGGLFLEDGDTKISLDPGPGAIVQYAQRKVDLTTLTGIVVCVSAPHRHDAIEACHWGIDRLKESVPIWKKEHAADGTYWIEGNAAKPAV